MTMFYIFLADGFEECEALVPLDLIRRAGIKALTVGVTGKTVRGSHGINVEADILPEQIDLSDLEGVMLPGGMPGTKNLAESAVVRDCLAFAADNGKLTAAICAAPSVPGKYGYLKGRRAVCFPGFENALTGAIPSASSVEKDGNYITAKGAGCVFPFAHAIITVLKDAETADGVIASIQYTDM